jgi:hypothetical protein
MMNPADAGNGIKIVLGAAGTLYLVKQLGRDIEMEGQHWIMLLVILVAGYVLGRIWTTPATMVGLP